MFLGLAGQRGFQLAGTVGCLLFSSPGSRGWKVWTEDARRDTPQFKFCHLFGAEDHCPFE